MTGSLDKFLYFKWSKLEEHLHLKISDTNLYLLLTTYYLLCTIFYRSHP